jgi:hypothetical protein
VLAWAYAGKKNKQRKYVCDKRRHLPTSKPKYKEREIVSQATFVINPALRLECIRLGVDFWISRDGPDVVIF